MSRYISYEKRMGRIQQEWDKKHTRRFVLKLHTVLDADIIQLLENSGNIQGYLKKLIREEIARNEQSISTDLPSDNIQ